MTMKRAALAGWMTALLLTTVAVAGVSGATFTVDSTGDQADATPGDGVCAGSGGCTLRAAIEEANAFAGADVIAFDIPGKGVHKIAPLSPLPQITGAVTIDGYTQPGAAPNTSPTSAGINAVLMIELSGYMVLQYADVRAAYSVSMTGRALALFTMAMFLGVALMQWLTGAAGSASRGSDA